MLDQTQIDAAVDRALAHLDRLRAAEAYAGLNPMRHHADDGPTQPGMAGAYELGIRLFSAELPKFNAGQALVRARLNRALGNLKGARIAVEKAAACRRLAQQRAKASLH